MKKLDYLLTSTGLITAVAYLIHLFSLPPENSAIGTFSHGAFELMNKMWWGLLFGILFIGLLNKVPKSLVMAALGTQKGLQGLLRATLAGFVLDLCSHGILMVASKLYERGASTGQTIAFLIASPWNSISLTLILFFLIGVFWTLSFILLSFVIAIISGLAFDALTSSGRIEPNPNRENLPDTPFLKELKENWAKVTFSRSLALSLFTGGLSESRMVLRWIFLGVVIAAGMRAFLSLDTYSYFFSPTLAGQGWTLIFATIIEVCSEGSAPIAADIFNLANAPGNAFIFLMAGAATDYTEIMVLKEMTKGWKIPLLLPVVAVPQIFIFGTLLNFL